jgi:starch synthase (maltosyl-transferring)
VKNQADIPLIFNLFPRHFKTIDSWSEIIPHVKEMGFNAIYVNPFHETGFSGSLYAVKDYYRLNPLFLSPGADPSDFTPLRAFINKCKSEGVDLIMDLVINHTAFDSVLTKSHPDWYKRDADGKFKCPYAVDPSDPSNVTVWGDLAIIDNEKSKKREELWNYWDSLIGFFQKMGILGYRCDAAYQIPAPLWEYLISSAKKRDSGTKFFAETLGCQMSEIEALAHVGFDYLFNSSKWWNFDKPWAIEQHERNRMIAPSIAFPESHDTERLAELKPGTVEVQKNRYAFAALFSKGLLMPSGYEFGAVTRMNVVNGTPADVDKPQWDLTQWIKQINKLKLEIPVLSEEGQWGALSEYHLPFIFLQKSSGSGNAPVYVCINKRLDAETEVKEWMIPRDVKLCKKAIGLLSSTIQGEDMPQAFTLDPSDVVLFVPA